MQPDPRFDFQLDADPFTSFVSVNDRGIVVSGKVKTVDPRGAEIQLNEDVTDEADGWPVGRGPRPGRALVPYSTSVVSRRSHPTRCSRSSRWGASASTTQAVPR